MPESNATFRRYQRVPFRMPALIILGQSRIQSATVDVSYAGFFLHTEEFVELRQLIKVHFEIPFMSEPFEMLAMVVRHVLPEEAAQQGRQPGMGCTFYANPRNMTQEWESFVRQQMQLAPPQRFGSQATPKRLTEVPIEVGTLEGLHQIVTDMLGMGTMTLRCAQKLPIGAALRLLFEHPEDGTRFPVHTEVLRHIVDRDGSLRLELALLEQDEEPREKLRGFVNSVVPGRTSGPRDQAPEPPVPNVAPSVTPVQTTHASNEPITETVNQETTTASIPILSDRQDLTFTGLITEEVVLLDDFMDDLFHEVR